MSKNLDILQSYFLSGTAEGERTILDKVFIFADEFKKIISPPPGNPILLVGNKGSGKSALIEFAFRMIKSQNTPCVLLTPFDIDTSTVTSGASTGDMVRAFYDIILISIAKKLSEEDTGWLKSEYATLYYAAVDAGARASDLPGKIGKFISEASKSITKIDLNSAFPHLTATTRDDVEKSAQKIVGRRRFYIFIDDTDQISSPDEKSHLNRVWALLLASRRIAGKIPEINCIISLRSEVWSRLQRDEAGQRDQSDHFKNLVVNITGSKEHVRKIISRRLSLANADLQKYPAGPYELFFEGQGARAPQSKTFRSWEDLILVRSRERPRDAIQMIGALASHAAQLRKDRIDEAVFQQIMPSFSRSIAEQFGQEVVLECPEALEILKSFSSANFDDTGFTMSAESALKHFKNLPSRFAIRLFGRTIHQGVDQDAFELWQFFYLCGILNARVSDMNMKDNFRHLNAAHDPFFVSKVRWNELQKALWEVNTAYRDYLIQIQSDAAAHVGLPIKRRTRKTSR